MEICIKSLGRGVNKIGEGLQDPIYRGKNYLVLRSEYEVLERKNTWFLERGLYITSNLLESCLINEYKTLISESIVKGEIQTILPCIFEKLSFPIGG